jgi:hypothetical protein
MERREGKLTSIGQVLERNIVLKGAALFTIKGYTQVPNHVLMSNKISPGAKLTYAMLLKHAWEKNFCYPGQETLAKDLGGGVRSVIQYMQELEKAGFLKIVRRGQGKPNLYELNITRTNVA